MATLPCPRRRTDNPQRNLIIAIKNLKIRAPVLVSDIHVIPQRPQRRPENTPCNLVVLGIPHVQRNFCVAIHIGTEPGEYSSGNETVPVGLDNVEDGGEDFTEQEL